MKKLMAMIFTLSALSASAADESIIHVDINVDLVDSTQLIITDTSTGKNHLSSVNISHGTVSRSNVNPVPASSKQLYVKRINRNGPLAAGGREVIFYFNDQPELYEHTHTLTGSSAGSNTLDTKLTVKKGSIRGNVLPFTVNSDLQAVSDSAADLYSGTATLNVIVQ